MFPENIKTDLNELFNEVLDNRPNSRFFVTLEARIRNRLHGYKDNYVIYDYFSGIDEHVFENENTKDPAKIKVVVMVQMNSDENSTFSKSWILKLSSNKEERQIIEL